MTISPAAQKILDAAIQHFSDKGFDAGSLSAIAENAGIKKATIYSHFKNKEELFMHAFEEAAAKESTFVDECFSSEAFAGEKYLMNVNRRYQESVQLRFLLRTAFIPPEELRSSIHKGYEAFLEQIKRCFISELSPRQLLTETLYVNAYLGIVDSVHVELLYASQQAAEARREALWSIFYAALNRS